MYKLHKTCIVHQYRIYFDFSDKTKWTPTGSTDKSDIGAADESIPLDPAIQFNTSGETAENQSLESSSVYAEEPLVAATSDINTEEKQKGKSPKIRPSCLLCNKSFYTRYKLNEHHAVVHLEKRLFSCNVCHKTFGRADHLIRHVKNRVCISRQYQQLLDLADSSGKTGDYNYYYY